MLCVILTIASILTELFIIESLLTKRENDAETINMAGRQRTLSQKIVKNFYAYPKDPSLLVEIHGDATKWNEVHQALQADYNQVFSEDKKRAKIDSLFATINPYEEKLFNLVMIGNLEQNLYDNHASIKDWEERFLDGMDVVLDFYQKESEAAISRLENVVKVFSLLFTIVVLSLYFFFVNPIITSMRKLAMKQKAQNQNMASILENTEDPIWSVNRDLRLLTFNSAFRERMKKEQGKLPKLRDNILEYPIHSAELARAWYERAFMGETFRIDHELVHNEKTTYHELSFNPIHDEDGKISGCNVFRRNETQRIVTINKLKKSRETLKEAQMIAKLGNWNWDMAKDKLHWSDELYKVFGQNPETFNASYKGLLQIIHPDDREMFDEDVKNCIASGETHDIVHRIVLGDGSIRHIHERGMVFYDGKGQPIRMAGTSQDVTILENAKNEILKQYEELQNFVYILSHNVRSPISTLQGLVTLFQEGDEETNKEVVEMIGTKVDILDETIRDLNKTLSMQKVSKSSFEWVDIGEILHNVVELLQNDIKISGAIIKQDIDPVHEVYVIKSYLSNILLNLVLNAINYKQDNMNPVILVSTRLDSKLGEVEITVEDNCIGMDLNEKRRKKIFGMYGRLNGDKIGKGLGLFLVKTQVEAMEGGIDVVSEPGKGSKFTISLKHKIKDTSAIKQQ